MEEAGDDGPPAATSQSHVHMSSAERRAAKPTDSLLTMLEVIGMRGYVPQSVLGASPQQLEHMQRACRDLALNTGDALRFLDMKLDEAPILEAMAAVKGHIVPVATAVARDDLKETDPAHAAGDRPGDVLWILMAKNGLVHTPPEDPAEPEAEEDPAGGGSRKKKRKRKPRKKVRRVRKCDICQGFNKMLATELIRSQRGVVRRVILVTMMDLFGAARDVLLDRHAGIVVEPFILAETQRNAVRHEEVPFYEIVGLDAWDKRLRSLDLPGTPMSDVVVRLLGLPVGTLLRIHVKGLRSPVEPVLTRVAYTHKDTPRSFVDGPPAAQLFTMPPMPEDDE